MARRRAPFGDDCASPVTVPVPFGDEDRAPIGQKTCNQVRYMYELQNHHGLTQGPPGLIVEGRLQLGHPISVQK